MSLDALHALLPGEDSGLQSLADRTALITGASSGIGLATAMKLAAQGVHLKLVARRAQRLELIQNTLCKEFPNIQVDILCGSLTNTSFLTELQQSSAYNSSSILINNAGLALGTDPIRSANTEDWASMLNTNMAAAFQISKAFVQSQRQHPRPVDIIHLGSVAGHFFYAGGSVYCATKAGFRAFHQALRQEELGQDLRCCLISPGHVRTEFGDVRHAGNTEKVEETYQGFTPLSAYDIANQIVFALQQPRHVNLHEVMSMGQMQAPAVPIHREP